jgi:hypothetical protein
MSKEKPNKVMSRMCNRHMNYVKECPRCNHVIPCEEHLDRARNLKVITPVYRKPVIYKGKNYKQEETV